MGYNDEDIAKPKIAIVNSSSNLAVCFSHLDEIADKLRDSINAAGGIAFEVRTVAPSDFITATGKSGGYILSARDLIASDIEAAVEGAQLDGMILLASCDKTVPGQLMAAARLNIPSLSIICGYQPSGKYKGKHNDIEDVFINVGHYQAGKITLEELTEMTDTAIQGPGTCPGMGTANSMACVTEALGMALPGNAPIMANTTNMWQIVRKAGERIVDMIWEDQKPRDILTEEAFYNAVKVTLSVAGSINCIKHLQAIAKETRKDIDVYKMFEDYADKIPLLVGVTPNGIHHIEDLEEAGGALGIMKQLESELYKEAMTVSGRTVGEHLKSASVNDDNVIRSMDNALSYNPPFLMVRGSLTPEYGIVKMASHDDRDSKFTGPAIVFENREVALEKIAAGQVKEGQVLVLRGYGIIGSPGHGLVSNVVFALDGAGLTGKVAMVTDGSVSGLCNKTLLVCESSPEAATGGPLALVEDGDLITIDVNKKEANLEISEEEMKEREKNLKPFQHREEHGWLDIYRRCVKPLKDGAVLSD
ncbi:MAG TPA: dihydroxy-acid dehydratase [Eubacteriaceae bacterium]|nr:dihydroxy-acid dehydratase [Eubacteriaceae bacterium]